MIGWIILGLVVVAFALAICAAHVPGLRELTGAAPLDREPTPPTGLPTQQDRGTS
ncbi:hypothetical protein [Streptomyces sp. RKAG337]|uniref:hypothetical protein n=1 Tax=Streptomyces sp. RKAG337 TaxID=2893404 RepID=UPI0020346CB4|nr:hypothetical protein [Streptomyces sp. RKAG337]MCM2427352.1 hypothetical protein [Streptomyces sp. RKAG337]